MASLAVSRDWWSYRSSLSRKSKASGLTRCWFSLWTKRSHRLRECLQSQKGNEKQTKGQRSPTFHSSFSLVAGSPANSRERSKLKRVVLYHSATRETTKLIGEIGNRSVAEKGNLGLDNFMKI